jgi:hypothetical protein
MSAESGNRTHATAKIAVKTYEPRPYEDPDQGPQLVQIHVVEQFSGDIEGDGVARFLQAGLSDDSASFVGLERVTGRIGERSGTFVLQDQGTLEGTTVSGRWFVVPGSGTAELEGLRGEGGFTAQLGEGADVTLDYWFD